MAKTDDLVLLGRDSREPLSKNQEIFNSLVKRIAKQEELIEKDTIRLDTILDSFNKEIYPLDQQMATNNMDMAILLSGAADRWKFSNEQREKLKMTILFLFEQGFRLSEPTPEQEEVYNRWSESTYAEEMEKEKREMTDYYEQQMKEMFGVDVDFSELENNPESFRKIVDELKEKVGQNNSKEKGGQGRKKSKKELEKELLKSKDEIAWKKSLRNIYFSLVKLLHPDRAENEEDRLVKEEVLKQVTKAYEENNLLALLRFEAKWLTGKAGDLAKLPDEKLKRYVVSLRATLKELEETRFMLQNSPRYTPIDAYRSTATKTALSYISKEADSKKEILFLMEGDLIRMLHKLTKNDVLEFTDNIMRVIDQQYADPLDFFWEDDD